MILKSKDDNSIKNKNLIKKYGIIATFFHVPIARILTKLIYKIRISPNVVTILGFLISSAGCFCFFFNVFSLKLIGFFLFHFGVIFDYVDGQLARMLDKTSRYGSWLDNSLDRIVEFFLIAGVSVNLLRNQFSVINIIISLITLFVVIYQFYIYDISFFMDSVIMKKELKEFRDKLKNRNVYYKTVLILRMFSARDVILTILSIGILADWPFGAMLSTIMIGLINIIITFVRETLTFIHLKDKY